MDLPFISIGPAGGFRIAAQPKVQRDEIETRADPGDDRDDMQPPDGEFGPVEEDRLVHLAAPIG